MACCVNSLEFSAAILYRDSTSLVSRLSLPSYLAPRGSGGNGDFKRDRMVRRLEVNTARRQACGESPVVSRGHRKLFIGQSPGKLAYNYSNSR